MNIIREEWWPTPIWSFDLPNSVVDISAIEKECIEAQHQDPIGRKISNINGWQSKEIVNNPPNNINKFKNFIEEISNAWFNDLGVKASFNRKISSMWININYQGSYNFEHTHGGSIFAGTVYVKTNPDAGKISFSNNSDKSFINQTFTESNNRYTFEKVWYPNTAGKVIIFPSWLAHSVEENRSSDQRISIAFNF